MKRKEGAKMEHSNKLLSGSTAEVLYVKLCCLTVFTAQTGASLALMLRISELEKHSLEEMPKLEEMPCASFPLVFKAKISNRLYYYNLDNHSTMECSLRSEAWKIFLQNIYPSICIQE